MDDLDAIAKTHFDEIVVIIVTWNSEKLIRECLSPFDSLITRPKVTVFDNNSSDRTVEIIKSDFNWVNLIESPENLGFGRANNEALRGEVRPFFVLLNPDAFIKQSDDIIDLVSILKSSRNIGSAGPMLINVDGSHQVGDCGWKTSISAVIGHVFWIHKVFAFVPSIYLSNAKLLKRKLVKVDWICGACIAIRREAWEDLEGFDIKIFMYGEDVDLGERMQEKGWRALYSPTIKVTHLQGGTQKSPGSTYYSSKWILARLAKYASANSWLKYNMLKLAFSVGFLFRTLIMLIARGAEHKRSMYLRFARDAWNAPSWSTFRKETS